MDRELTAAEIKKLNTNKALFTLLSRSPLNIERTLRYLDYERKLKKLQTEAIRLQSWVIKNNKRIVVVFEGRDAAGKGGAIRRITERINPRYMRIIALRKPSEDEESQWYFQRYIKNLPRSGQITFFDRSWYNRAVVEPVNGFCTDKEYKIFMNQVNNFEQMLIESGVRLVKFYFSISKDEQARRFKDIKASPVKKWKFSPVDQTALERWDDYTDYKKKMFEKTDTKIAPWIVIKANKKMRARVEVVQKLLEIVPYTKATSS